MFEFTHIRSPSKLNAIKADSFNGLAHVLEKAHDYISELWAI